MAFIRSAGASVLLDRSNRLTTSGDTVTVLADRSSTAPPGDSSAALYAFQLSRWSNIRCRSARLVAGSGGGAREMPEGVNAPICLIFRAGHNALPEAAPGLAPPPP